MFDLFVLIEIYISGSLKNYNHKYILQYRLCRGRLMNIIPLIKLFTANNNYLPLIKIFTVDNNSLPFIEIFTVNNNNNLPSLK